MWFTRVSISNPVFATMMMAALLVLGAFSYSRLPVEQFPDVSFPVVVVQTEYPGASPENVEEEVTRRIEESVNTISGIKTLSSRSYEGLSVVIIEFDLSIDPKLAAQDVREKIALIRSASATRSRSRASAASTRTISRSSRWRCSPPAGRLRELTTLADQVIKKRLENVGGVGQATLVGGVKREIKVYLNLEAMEAQKVGADQVVKALQSENQEVPAGSILTPSQEKIVQLRARLTGPQDFRNLIVARRGAGGKTTAVTLGSIAEIEDGQQEEENAALVNGQRALSHRHHQGAGREHHRGGRRRAPRGEGPAGLPARGRQGRDRARHLHRHPQLGQRREEDAARRRPAHHRHRVPVPHLLAQHRDHRPHAADRADRHLPLHVRVRLHAQRAHADGAVAVGGPADRRRDRGAREHRAPRGAGRRPPHRRARRHARDRPGGAGDHLLHRRGVPAGGLHGRHHRPLLPPVRPHRGRRGADLDVRVVHAGPDAVVDLARPAGRGQIRHRPARPAARLVPRADGALLGARTNGCSPGASRTARPCLRSPSPASSPASR